MEGRCDATNVNSDCPVVSLAPSISYSGTPADSNQLTAEGQDMRCTVVHAEDSFEELFDRTDPTLIQEYFSGGEDRTKKHVAAIRISSFMLQMSKSGPLRETLDLAIANSGGGSSPTPEAKGKRDSFMEAGRRVQMAYRIHKHRFPSPIWHCCRRLCFATIATDPLQFMLFDELIMMQEHAERFHASTEKVSRYVHQRRKGIGTSTVAFSAPSRAERELNSDGEHGTERQKALLEFGKFVIEVLPFLYGQADSPRGTMRPKRKLCTKAICCLLGVSRNFLYKRKIQPSLDSSIEEELTSLVDTAGLRLRQLRRNGDRGNYPQFKAYQPTTVAAICLVFWTFRNGLCSASTMSLLSWQRS